MRKLLVVSTQQVGKSALLYRFGEKVLPFLSNAIAVSLNRRGTGPIRWRNISHCSAVLRVIDVKYSAWIAEKRLPRFDRSIMGFFGIVAPGETHGCTAVRYYEMAQELVGLRSFEVFAHFAENFLIPK